MNGDTETWMKNELFSHLVSILYEMIAEHPPVPDTSLPALEDHPSKRRRLMKSFNEPITPYDLNDGESVVKDNKK